MQWLKRLGAKSHLFLGKLTRFVFYAALGYAGWYYLKSANITSTVTEQITLGQIFSVLIGAGIIIIAFFAFFNFPDEVNPLHEYSLYRSIWGNLGLFIILIAIVVYVWLIFYDHFDRPLGERVYILYNEQSVRVGQFLNEIFK
jgi:uncharacterized membrane protein YbhN (UPF0104 family)